MTFVFTENQRDELLVVIQNVLGAYDATPAQEGVMTAGYRKPNRGSFRLRLAASGWSGV